MKLNELKDRISEWSSLGQEKARSFWEGLNSRERWIVGIAGGAFTLAITAFVIQFMFGLLLSSFYSPAKVVSELNEIQSLLQDSQSLRQDALQYDRLLRRQTGDFKLETFAENQAKQFGVKIQSLKASSIKSRWANPQDKLFEIEIEKNSDFEPSMKFLDSLQDSLGVKIVNLEIRSAFKDKSKIDLKAIIAYSQKS